MSERASAYSTESPLSETRSTSIAGRGRVDPPRGSEARAGTAQFVRPSAVRSRRTRPSAASMPNTCSSATQRREQVDPRACITEGGELGRGEAGRVQDADAADAKTRLAAEHQFERAVEGHGPSQRCGGPRGDRVAPACDVDRHVEQGKRDGRAEHRRDRQAGQRRGEHGDQSPARHRVTRARVAMASR